MTASERTEVSHYLVCINDLETSSIFLPAEKILDVLTRVGIWQIGDNAAGRTSIAPGDRMVFYMAGKDRSHIVGTATVASRPEPIAEGKNLPFMSLSFAITDIDIWEEPRPIRPLLPTLSFVKKRLMPYWGLYFRQATRKLSKKDFDILTAGMEKV